MGWAARTHMGNTLGIDMGYTSFLPSPLRRSALRAVERSGTARRAWGDTAARPSIDYLEIGHRASGI